MTNISTQIADQLFHTCFMNAAGVHCQTAEELNDLVNSQAGTFITKTATVQARQGNPSPRYYAFGQNSINSMGLPNEGIDYYLDYLNRVPHPERRFLSIAPMQTGELAQLIEKIHASNFKGFVELNLSCPNITGKPQTGYDFEQSAKLIQELTDLTDLKTGVKLPPYFDFVHFDKMADILNHSKLTFITCINSIGNGLVIEGLSTVIAPKNGFGGIGGPAVKATALANIHAFKQRLKPDFHIIGAGGVVNGRDAFEHILCGADLVQVGTHLYQEGPQVFDQLAMELQAEMAKYNFNHLADFKGKLQYMVEK